MVSNKFHLSEPAPQPLHVLSVIIPTNNEEYCNGTTVANVLRLAGVDGAYSLVEVIVVDAGSKDETIRLAREAGARVIVMPGLSRAERLNAGAAAAGGGILFFLHADSRPPENYTHSILHTLKIPGTIAGAFLLKIDASLCGIRLVQCFANLRAWLFQLPYGDQGLFLSREVFERVRGYPPIAFMDDYAMARRIARAGGRIRIANAHVVTSGRRWRTLGVLRTTLLNQCIILAYNIGVPVSTLRRWYYGVVSFASRRDGGCM